MSSEHGSIARATAELALVDIGLNLGSARFNQDRTEVLQRAREAGIAKTIVTGTSVEASVQALELCQRYAAEYPGMLYATVGIHPHDASTWKDDTLRRLRGLVQNARAVAIGETGLDFNRDYSPRIDQEKAFELQIELASSCGLPLFLHERDAHRRQLEILKSHRDQFSDAVIHCFTGTRSDLFNYLDLNLHIGITGWICDPRRGLELRDMAKNIPLDRLMIETDAPFLLPKNIPRTQPLPAHKNRNEPACLPWVLNGLALCREESPSEIARATTANACRVFRLGRARPEK